MEEKKNKGEESTQLGVELRKHGNYLRPSATILFFKIIALHVHIESDRALYGLSDVACC